MSRIFIVGDIKQFSSLVRRACAGATDASVDSRRVTHSSLVSNWILCNHLWTRSPIKEKIDTNF